MEGGGLGCAGGVVWEVGGHVDKEREGDVDGLG